MYQSVLILEETGIACDQRRDYIQSLVLFLCLLCFFAANRLCFLFSRPFPLPLEATSNNRSFGIGIDVSICVGYVTADHTHDHCRKVGWMPRATWAIVLCAVVMGLGCEKFFTSPDRPVATSIARSLAPAIPPDSLIVESVLLERPIGDVFLDRDLWASTLPVGSPEIRSLLAENGIRAGILTGNLPTQFQTMLDNKADVVAPPLMWTFNNRKEAVIPTAGPIEECTFDMLPDLAGKPE